jgi:IS5 family transposase
VEFDYKAQIVDNARRKFDHRRAFRDKIKWRTGSEGRARTWCGHGVFAHNLVKISILAA